MTSGFAPDGYYSFTDLAGNHNGLVRVSGDHFAYVGEGGVWVDDQSLARHFIDPGADDPLDRIPDGEARRLAALYGVAL